MRGVGGEKDAAIKKVIEEHNTLVVGLLETKHSTISKFKIKKWWGSSEFNWVHTTTLDGNGGPICT